ncbi:MAG: hypothetical protein KGS72_28950, partial [Cyanobacteria bacterium REEB67]|nr:hypothetical protein [Cyanobacteria bacterium REEB67]
GKTGGVPAPISGDNSGITGGVPAPTSGNNGGTTGGLPAPTSGYNGGKTGGVPAPISGDNSGITGGVPAPTSGNNGGTTGGVAVPTSGNNGGKTGGVPAPVGPASNNGQNVGPTQAASSSGAVSNTNSPVNSVPIDGIPAQSGNGKSDPGVPNFGSMPGASSSPISISNFPSNNAPGPGSGVAAGGAFGPPGSYIGATAAGQAAQFNSSQIANPTANDVAHTHPTPAFVVANSSPNGGLIITSSSDVPGVQIASNRHDDTKAQGAGGAHSVHGKNSGWLDQATANLGAGGLGVAASANAHDKTHNQGHNSHALDNINTNNNNVSFGVQWSNFDPASAGNVSRPDPISVVDTGLISDYVNNNTSAPKAGHSGSSIDGSWNGNDSANAFAQGNGQWQASDNGASAPNWQNALNQSFDVTTGMMANSESIVRHIEEQAQIIRTTGENQAERQEAQKEVTRKEEALNEFKQQNQKLLDEEHARIEKQHRDEREKRLADEMMTVLALRKESEAISRARVDRARAEREAMQDIVRKELKQEKYVVKTPEDLTNIARKKFINPSISQLIYELNPGKVDIKWVNGQPVYIARPGVTLTLPNQRQVKEWLQKKNHVARSKEAQATSQGLVGQQKSPGDERLANIEKILGKIKQASDERSYAVRLGDTLRSVAMKHPEMRDVSLWKLLASKNGLPVDTDSKGAPLAILIRGTSIVLPTAEEIELYRAENGTKRSAEPSQVTTGKYAEMANVATKLCLGCKRLLSSNSNLCPACGFVFEVPQEQTVTDQATTFALPEDAPTTFVVSDAPTTFALSDAPTTLTLSDAPTTFTLSDAPTTLSLPEHEKTKVVSTQDVTTLVDFSTATGLSLSSSGLKPSLSPAKASNAGPSRSVITGFLNNASDDPDRSVKPLNETCRLIKVEKEINGKISFYQQLEVLTGEEWMPVLSYEVGQDASVRHEYSKDGRKKTIKIDLPAGTVGEMVENELSKNWLDYCNRYLSGRKLSA